MYLFAKFRNRRRVNPSVVPGATVHVYMIIESQSTFSSAFIRQTDTADVAPVVVAGEDGDIIGYTESFIVITLNFGEDSPQLRYIVRWSLIYLTDDAAL